MSTRMIGKYMLWHLQHHVYDFILTEMFCMDIGIVEITAKQVF